MPHFYVSLRTASFPFLLYCMFECAILLTIIYKFSYLFYGGFFFACHFYSTAVQNPGGKRRFLTLFIDPDIERLFTFYELTA